MSSSKDLYQTKETKQSHEPSYYDKSVLEKPKNRDVQTMGHEQLRLALEGDYKQIEQRLEGRTQKLRTIIGNDFSLSAKEAIVILCGLSHGSISFEHSVKNSQKILYESGKLRSIGQNTYQLTKETLLLFGDLQHLSTPWQELVNALTAVNDDTYIIPQYMRANGLYDLVIPFRGSTTGLGHLLKSEPEEISEIGQRKLKIQEATNIGSFHTLIGLLVLKYGKEKVVEEFLVPRVFNGNNGIIEIITSQIGSR